MTKKVLPNPYRLFYSFAQLRHLNIMFDTIYLDVNH